ncbi:MAG TPA: hypothetical protein VFP40_14455, partial [Terriglobales bacterium]|nr:hypothetical protein [Terriglobales bacterium]
MLTQGLHSSRSVSFLLVLTFVFLPSTFFSQTVEREKEDLDARNAYLLQRYTGGGELPSVAERVRAIVKMNADENNRRKVAANAGVVLDPTWKAIGPRPTVHTSVAGGDIQVLSDATSGHVEAVAVDPRNRDVVYAGAATGGVWKTVDAGVNWTPLTDFQPSIATGSIALDPTNPDIVYVGTGDSSFSLGSLSGAGVLKSTDAGQTWQVIGADAFHMSTATSGLGAPGISVSPDGKRILVAMNSNLGDVSGGIFLSTDGGATWTRTLAGIRASDVQFATNTVAYAGASLAVNSNSGVYKSTDGGSTWSFLQSLGALIPHPARTRVSVSTLNPQTVYAVLADGNDSNVLGGMFRSSDAGVTWQPITVPNFCGPQCGWDMVVSVSPVDPNIVWVGGAAGLDSLLRSSDGGLTWTRANNNIHVDHHALTFSTDGTRLYGGNDGGIYSTEDVQTGTVVWKNLNGTIQVTQFYAGLGLHPTDPDLAIGGTQDNGTSFYSGSLNWTFIYGGDTGAGVISATDPSTLYLANASTIVKTTQPSSAFAFGAATIADNAPWASMLVGDP